MPVRQIQTPPPWHEGLEFGGYFHNQHLVEVILFQLLLPLGDVAGYCLEFHEIRDGESWFKPYAGTGLIEMPVVVPPKVAWRKLLPDAYQWPVLAQNVPGDPIPPIFQNAVWKGQVRLNNNGRYVGYFKVVAKGKSPISDQDFFAAYITAKTTLDLALQEMRTRSSEQLVSLSATREHIDRNLKNGNPRGALQHFTALTTSHHGASLNRVAVFVQVGDALECVHAHGGDGTNAWTILQGVVSQAATNVSKLHEMLAQTSVDPLRDDLIGERIPMHSDSLIASVWRNGLNLNDLPIHLRFEVPPLIEKIGPNVEIPFGGQRIIGAALGHDDPWFVEHRNRRPNSVVFNSQNGKWFLVPWKVGSKPMGVLLFDLTHWGNLDAMRDVIPRLRQAVALLEYFAPVFGSITKW